MAAIDSFKILREQLDDSGYRELLMLECVPLISHMFRDLQGKHKENENISKCLDEMTQRCLAAELCVKPYQQENGQLQKDVNRLHMENVTLREYNHKVHKEHENALQKLSSDNKDLKFLVDELKNRQKSLEKESIKKSAKILELQERNFKAVVVTPGGTKHPIASHKQRMQIGSFLPPAQQSASTMLPKNNCLSCGCGANSSDLSKTKELLSVAEKRILLLQEELDARQERLLALESERESLEEKVANREGEISRLHGLLQGGRPVEAVLKDNKLTTAETKVENLQLHVTHLSKVNAELELKLKSLLGDTHEAMGEAVRLAGLTEGLQGRLHNADSTNRKLMQDSKARVNALSARLVANEEKLEDYRGNLEEQHTLFHSTRDERDRLRGELVHLKQSHSCLTLRNADLEKETERLFESLKMAEAEKTWLEEVLSKGHGEKKKLDDRINTLTVKSQEGEMEVGQLRTEASALRNSVAASERKATDAEAARDVLAAELEKVREQKKEADLEKTFFKGELVKLQNTFDTVKKEKNDLETVQLQLEEKQKSMRGERQDFEEHIENYKIQISEWKIIEQKLKEKITQLSRSIEQIELQRDHYIDQVSQLLEIVQMKPSSMGAAHMAKSKLKPEEELGKALYERDVLKQERNFLKAQLDGMKKSARLHRHKKTEESIDSPDKALPEDVQLRQGEKVALQQQVEQFQKLFQEAQSAASSYRRKKETLNLYRKSSSSDSCKSSEPDVPVIKNRSSNEGPITAQLKAVSNERDFFRQEYERLKTVSVPSPTDGSSLDSLDVGNLLKQKEILTKERDFYVKQYRDLSQGLSQTLNFISDTPQKILVCQLEEELVNVTKERKELEELQNETRKKMEKYEKNIANTLAPSLQAFISEIRESRDFAMDEVDKAKSEKAQIQQKLKLVLSQNVREHSRAQQGLAELRLKSSEDDCVKAELEERVQAQTHLNQALQDQVNTLQDALNQVQGELGKYSKQSGKFKKLLDDKASHADTQGQRLAVVESELVKSSEKVVDLERETEELQEKIANLEGQNETLQKNLGIIDADKDQLNAELDAKAELVNSLKVEMKKRSAQVTTFESQLKEKEAALKSCETSLAQEKQKLAEEGERSSRFQRDLAKVTQQRDSCNREIRRLQKEVVGAAGDLKDLKAQLELVEASRDEFKEKAQEYCQTLEGLSANITLKDKEQDDLMKEYLSLNETINSLKSQNASLENATASQVEEISRMEQIIQSFKEEREQLIAQVTDSLEKLNALEEACNQLEKEKFDLENELLVAKEITQKLETKRGEIDAESRRLATSLEKTLESKRETEEKLEALVNQLTSERSTLRSLEAMVADRRKQEFLAESALQQLKVEKTQLERRVSELSEELASELEEVKRLRSRSAQLELESERLRRQLTEEQYEKERAVQELRRVRKYSSIDQALVTPVTSAVSGTIQNVDSKVRESPVLSGSLEFSRHHGGVASPPNESLDILKRSMRQPSSIHAHNISRTDFVNSPTSLHDYNKETTRLTSKALDNNKSLLDVAFDNLNRHNLNKRRSSEVSRRNSMQDIFSPTSQQQQNSVRPGALFSTPSRLELDPFSSHFPVMTSTTQKHPEDRRTGAATGITKQTAVDLSFERDYNSPKYSSREYSRGSDYPSSTQPNSSSTSRNIDLALSSKNIGDEGSSQFSSFRSSAHSTPTSQSTPTVRRPSSTGFYSSFVPTSPPDAGE